MKNKREQWLGNMFKWLLIILNLVAALALFLSFLAHLVHPTFSTTIAYCGLLFPYFLFANLVFVIVWLVFDYRWALLSTILILINVNNIDKHYQLRGLDKPETCANCLKVMSYNAKLFGVYSTDDKAERQHTKNQIINFIHSQRPDILCIQEYFNDKSGRLNFKTTEDILDALDLPNNDRTYRLYVPIESKRGYQYGLAIFSRYRIINSGYVATKDSSTNKSMYVDIRYNGDTLRIYNVHLSSMHIDYDDYETGKSVMNRDMKDPKFNKKALKLYNKVGNAFQMRQKQAIAVRKDIDSCKCPVIICGDFNDSPGSFSYHKIAHGFTDTFRNSGKGRGTTYFGDAFPSYRIDYILHDKQFNDFGHKVCTQIKASDHYPIFSYISIIKKQ